MDKNKLAYQDQEISHLYLGKFKLYGAEKKFIMQNHGLLSGLHMLDVGIGGGRTTHFFAPLVASYSGIDYTASMISHCKIIFKSMANASFFEMDARNLSAFSNAAFDLVLFSFNGIDYVSHGERNSILRELHRVLRPHGMLLFSFHNARHIDRLYSFQMPRNPFKIRWEMRRRKQLYSLNDKPESFRNKNIFHLYDGADDFKTLITYMAPEQQLNDLKNTGFGMMEWSDLQSGRVLHESSFQGETVPWISVCACKE